MTDQHRAKPEHWLILERQAETLGCASSNAILELRARIEALEAAQLEQAESNRFCTDAIVRRVEALEAAHEATAMAELRAASAEVRPTVKDSLTDGGGLVERVAYAMGPQSQAAMDAGELPHGAARAAIREVAKWLREGGDYSADAWADMLEREVFRG
jgi:hypothetical protein